MTSAVFESYENLLCELVQRYSWSHKKISVCLQENNPGVRGLSERSVRRFCSSNNIHRTSRVDDPTLDEAVSNATDMVLVLCMFYSSCDQHGYIATITNNFLSQVGPVYGRKTMTGLLLSQGLKVSQTRVGAALRRTNPLYHFQRCTSAAALINPIPYSADYFGHKLHVDQNEKLVMYGVTHVCARDGYSGKVVAIKNNLEIYTHLFRFLLR